MISMGGLAIQLHVPICLRYLLSPGSELGHLAMEHANGFLDSIGRFAWTTLSVNLIYGSSILFGLLSLPAKYRISTKDKGSN